MLGGHLARRCGALLLHSRLRRVGHQTRLLVHLDPLLASKWPLSDIRECPADDNPPNIGSSYPFETVPHLITFF
jgi:hypothetical protein